MPAKRRAAAVESESEAGSSQASKRARPAEDSDVEIQEAPQASGSGSRSRRQESANEPVDVDDDDEEMEQREPDEEEEEQFEKDHEEAIRKKVLGGHKGQGVSIFIGYGNGHREVLTKLGVQNIAEMGIIERLELVQFMCHKYLVFTFGPQINFIIGMNYTSILYCFMLRQLLYLL